MQKLLKTLKIMKGGRVGLVSAGYIYVCVRKENLKNTRPKSPSPFFIGSNAGSMPAPYSLLPTLKG